MWKFAASACLAVPLGIVAATPGLAFGDGCGDRAIECYDKVRLPDVYATRTRPVLVSPSWREVVATPPLIRNYAVPVEVRPARWRTVITPPVYGTTLQRVLVAPRRRTYVEIPAVTRRFEQTVVVAPGGIRWERRRGLIWTRKALQGRVAAGRADGCSRGRRVAGASYRAHSACDLRECRATHSDPAGDRRPHLRAAGSLR